MTDLPILDLYSGLDHKIGMGDDGGNGLDAAPSWANEHDSRRLNAYFRMTALREGKGRMLVRPDPLNPGKADQWREFGDVAVIVDQQAGSVLGEGPELEIVGADESLPPTPDIPDPPEPLADTDDEAETPDAETDPAAAILAEIQADIYQISLDAWEANVRSIIAEWQQRTEERPALVKRQRWLRQWAEDDRYLAKITELEHDCVVPLGDGVIVHGYDHNALRPTTEIFHPESYFPVLDHRSTTRYPRKVHIAWNFTNPVDDELMLLVQTWELVDIRPESEDDAPADQGDALRYLAEGQVQRDACLYSHRVYLDADVEELDKIDEVRPKWFEQHEVRPGVLVDADRVPWHTDFLPIVHVPNTLATLEHFGRSPILRIAQAADELAQNDAWEALGAHYAARPVTGVDDGAARPKAIDLTPGQTVYGKLSVVDMAAQLVALMDRGDRLRSTLLTNSFTPEGMVGRISPDEVPSGLALSLSFSAFEQMVGRMRMAREHKYALSAKMVQRLAIQHQAPSLVGDGQAAGEAPMVALPARLRFGTFMPQDLAGASKVIQLLAEAMAASPETLVRMAQDAGAPIDDVDAEVARLYRLMTARADEMTSATEDPAYAIELLGLEPRDGNDPDGIDAEDGDVVTPEAALLGA